MSNTLYNEVEQHDKVSGAKLGLIFKRQLNLPESIPIWHVPSSLHYFTLRKIGPEIRAHNLSCQLQFFGAFTKGESRILFRSIVGQQRIGIFAVLLFLCVGFSNSFVLQF